MKRAVMICGALFFAVGARGQDTTEAWRSLVNFRPDAGIKVFEQEMKSGDAAKARVARFGRAVALLDRQPVSLAQIEEARGVFAQLATDGSDHVALGARFFLGRIAQHHLLTPNNEEAARQYRQLIADYPESLWAQSALSRLALLEVYALNPTLSPTERIANAEKLIAIARTPSAESELHLVVASSLFFYRLPSAPALPHLLAVERLGRVEWTVRSEVLVQVAELSRLAGEGTQAERFYKMFLKENPSDPRGFIIRQRLAMLEPKVLTASP